VRGGGSSGPLPLHRSPKALLHVLVVILVLVTTLALSSTRVATQPDGDWRFYGRDPGGTRYSPLQQLTPANVSRLERAWTYHTGEVNRLPNISPDKEPPAFECTPLVVDGVMYVVTPSSRLIALDAETGTERWEFDPQADAAQRGFHQIRGLSYWEAPHDVTPRRRLFFGTPSGELACLDAESGTPCTGFGVKGRIDLRKGVADAWPSALYALTSAPALYGHLVIVGTRVQESPARGPGGVVRAFHARTGDVAWEFRSIPRSREPGAETWESGSAAERSGVNAWTTISVDTERGLVFVPFGSPAYDFFGGDRPGENLFANALVALDATTGQRRWHYQMVHHDIWDYDLAAQPVLATIPEGGQRRDVVIQVTKMGLVFVLDRETGKPVFPMEERPVPRSEVPGEVAWPTQPFPLAPPPLVRHTISAEDLTEVTPESARYCRELFASVAGGRIFTPIGSQRTLIVPGNLGGANWSGAAYDPVASRLFVNVNELPLVASLGLKAGSTPSINHYRRFLDENGWPCVKPPWGALAAVDLSSGEIAWKVPLGNAERLASSGGAPTGTPNLGGPIATAGGLVFIAATTDRRMRAFDSRTGKELWAAALEASGHATPATYYGTRSGRQFVAVAAGGGGYLSPENVSDVLVAFALPVERRVASHKLR
jgi:glucose dehydrogenase